MSISSKLTKKSLKQLQKITGSSLTLGGLILAIRRSDEISQVDFAYKLGVSKQYLCDLEHDRKSVSPKLAATYAKILGYAPEQFIRLCLQDIVDREGLKVIIEVKPKLAC